MTPRVIFTILLLPLSGCATFVHSELDDGTKDGVRYSLPVPFLQVTPKPDGTIENSILYLPDPQATYVLQTKSRVSSYTLDVQLQNQMLKSVSMSSKSDAVAAALADSAGNVAKAKIEADATAEEESNKADTDAAKALADAELNVRVATAKVQVLTDNKASADDIISAKVEERSAIIKRDALLKANNEAGSALAAANAPEASRSGQGKMVAGAMLFRIVPDGEGVKLVAVKGPTVFATSDAGRMESISFEPSGTINVKAEKDKALQFEVSVNRTIQIDKPQLYSEKDPTKELVNMRPTASKTSDAKGTKITFVLDPVTPSGDYAIILPYALNGGTKYSTQINIRVDK